MNSQGREANVTIEDVRAAAARISGLVRRTPVESADWLTDRSGREVFLKYECWQATGSFKLRGAAARLTALTEAERARGVLTVSAGNHGLAVAHCAAALGLDARIVVPRSASRAKVEAIRRYPVELVEAGEGYDEAERLARRMEEETGRVFVSPYNDPWVIAGQGTAMLEFLEDAPGLDAVIVPVGGGGLLAGTAVAARAVDPRMKVYGAEPKTTPTMTAALRAGRIVEIDEEETLADGLAGNIEPGSITFPIIQRLADDVVLVGEEAIRDGVRRMAREAHVMIEGSAAVALAALDENLPDAARIGVMVTGRNITLDLFARLIADA